MKKSTTKKTTKKKTTKKETTKKENAQLKIKDREWRLQRAAIDTQLDNAISSFMYTIESSDFTVEKSAENWLIEFLFNPTGKRRVEKMIKSGEEEMVNLISAFRGLAECVIRIKKDNTEKTKGENKIFKVNVEKAIEIQKKNKIWPFYQ